MKAERLISILLILQKYKKINTEELASELGVSVRTIFRDLTELSANGFPIYCEHGPGGGVRIIEEYKGGVKTLTKGEVEALKWLNIPEQLTLLDTGKTLQTAMMKVLGSFPDQGGQSQNLLIDWTWWRPSENVSKSKLEQLFDAVSRRQELHVVFPLWNRMDFAQDIEPYGIVAKAGEWYLVYYHALRFRMRRISDFSEIRLTGRTFIKPDSFDLEKTWKELCVNEESNYFSYTVELLVTVEIAKVVGLPAWGIPYKIREMDMMVDAEGWVHCKLDFENIIAARTHLLGWGNAVKVITPEALRYSLVDFAAQIMDVYSE